MSRDIALCVDLAEMCQGDGVLHMVKIAASDSTMPTQPLREDIHLNCFAPLKETQKSLNFDPRERLDLSPQQEVTCVDVEGAGSVAGCGPDRNLVA